MAVRRPLVSLGKAALAAAAVLPPTAVWLSGRLGRGAEGDPPPPASVPLATLPRSETAATPGPRLPPPVDVVPSPAPPVTVGPGSVGPPPPAAGAAPVPVPRGGQVVGEPQGVPDPNRSEAIPR